MTRLRYPSITSNTHARRTCRPTPTAHHPPPAIVEVSHARCNGTRGPRVPNAKSNRPPVFHGLHGSPLHRRHAHAAGGVGPVADFDPADFEVMEGVKECHR